MALKDWNRRSCLQSVLVISGVLLPTIGCETPAINQEQTIPTWQRSEVYFGLTKRDGSAITEAEWKQFVEVRIVPQFPSGFTILSAEGKWRDQSGVIRTEPSRVLVVMYRAADSSADTKLRRIAEHYAEQFNQEAILRADLKPRVEFIYAPSTAPAK